MGFGVWGLGFGVWGLGFGVWGLGFRVSGFGVRVTTSCLFWLRAVLSYSILFGVPGTCELLFGVSCFVERVFAWSSGLPRPTGLSLLGF